METVGQRLKALRDRRGLNQAQAARAMGYDNQVNLSRYENDTRNPSKKAALRLGEFYGVTAAFIIFGDQS